VGGGYGSRETRAGAETRKNTRAGGAELELLEENNTIEISYFLTVLFYESIFRYRSIWW
jgi:hypothetical protein